jgi:hypothetical protein
MFSICRQWANCMYSSERELGNPYSLLVLRCLDSFFLSTEITMKLKKTTLLIVAVLIVLVGLGVLVTNSDVKMAAIAKDIQKDHSRFTPSESVDVAMAMKLVTHEAPRMLNPPKEPNVLLLFPPSAEELARLTGE